MMRNPSQPTFFIWRKNGIYFRKTKFEEVNLTELYKDVEEREKIEEFFDLILDTEDLTYREREIIKSTLCELRNR
jgi:hypothetical protein